MVQAIARREHRVRNAEVIYLKWGASQAPPAAGHRAVVEGKPCACSGIRCEDHWQHSDKCCSHQRPEI